MCESLSFSISSTTSEKAVATRIGVAVANGDAAEVKNSLFGGPERPIARSINEIKRILNGDSTSLGLMDSIALKGVEFDQIGDVWSVIEPYMKK